MAPKAHSKATLTRIEKRSADTAEKNISANGNRKPVPSPESKTNKFREANFVIVTGMSGSGKGSVLKAFEDLGYFCVDNLPVDLIPKFADLCRNSGEISRAALVVDIREGEALRRFPAMYRQFRRDVPAILLFLRAGDHVLFAPVQ